MTLDESQAIHARLDGMAERLAMMGDSLAEIRADVGAILGACRPCREQVRRLDYAVRGNGGREGLEKDVASLKQSRSLARAAVLAAVGVSGSVLGALAQKLFGG